MKHIVCDKCHVLIVERDGPFGTLEFCPCCERWLCNQCWWPWRKGLCSWCMPWYEHPMMPSNQRPWNGKKHPPEHHLADRA